MPIFKNSLSTFKNKLVDIRANGFDYRGTCVEITEEYIFIRRISGYSQINMDRIQSIRLAGEKHAPLVQQSEDYFKPMDAENEEAMTLSQEIVTATPPETKPDPKKTK